MARWRGWLNGGPEPSGHSARVAGDGELAGLGVLVLVVSAAAVGAAVGWVVDRVLPGAWPR